MEKAPSKTFPPALAVGSRVWTTRGDPNHGPLDGPKVVIAAAQGGTVIGSEKPYQISSSLLYTVRWDDGVTAKHYSRDFICIGRFQNLKEFEQAIKPTGPVSLTLGPKGGFRQARLKLEYDGLRQTVEIDDRDLWQLYLEKIVIAASCEIKAKRLPK